MEMPVGQQLFYRKLRPMKKRSARMRTRVKQVLDFADARM